MKTPLNKHMSLYGIIFSTLAIIVFVINIAYRSEAQSKTPSDQINTFAMGNFEDYHQYIAMIKLGREGNLLYHNIYSEEPIPDVVFQTVFNLAGFLSRPFSLSLYDIYFILRLASLGLLFISVYVLIHALFRNQYSKIMAGMLFFSSTGFWAISSLRPFEIVKQILPYANFDLYLKHLVIPPHHNIALALFIFILLKFSSPMTQKKLLSTAALFAILGFVHPYIQYLAWIMIGLHSAIRALQAKTFNTFEMKFFISVTLLASPFILMNIYTHGAILRFGITNAGILSFLPRDTTITAYIQALGPMLFLAVPTIFMKKSYDSIIVRLLLIWAFLPLLLFFLPDLHIPFNTWRLYQIYQQIPLSLLSAYTIVSLFQHLKLYPYIALVFGMLSLVSGYISLFWTYRDVMRDPKYFAANRYIPDREVNIYSYLDTHTPKDSVVLAGTYVSNILPSFTHNRVIIGHNGLNRNYIAKQLEIGKFLGQNIPVNEVYNFLKKYHVNYIIFGTDAPKFADTIYSALPFLKELYTFEGLSVVQFIE